MHSVRMTHVILPTIAWWLGTCEQRSVKLRSTRTCVGMEKNPVASGDAATQCQGQLCNIYTCTECRKAGFTIRRTRIAVGFFLAALLLFRYIPKNSHIFLHFTLKWMCDDNFHNCANQRHANFLHLFFSKDKRECANENGIRLRVKFHFQTRHFVMEFLCFIRKCN